jgi:predicted aspartyl protease
MRSLIIYLIFLLPLVSFTQNINFNQGSVNSKEYFEVIQYEFVLGKIVIPVTINQKTYKFILDTGAPNIFSNTVLKENNLIVGDSINISDANNLNEAMKSAMVLQLKIGNLTFENQAGLVYNFENHILLKCYGIDGIIGSNLFRKSILKINSQNQSITITNKIKQLKIEKKPMKMVLVNNQLSPYIELKFIGKNKKKASDMVLVDTGMDGLYDMSKRAFSIFEEHKIFDLLSTSKGIGDIGIFGSGVAIEQNLVQIETTLLNQYELKNVVTSTTSDNNSRIGLDFLKHGNLTFDFINKKFYFEPVNTVELDPRPKFQTSLQNDKVVIGLIWDENLKKLMNSGDEVMSIDQENISEMSLCDYLAYKKNWKSKKKYNIKIKNKENNISEIEIVN